MKCIMSNCWNVAEAGEMFCESCFDGWRDIEKPKSWWRRLIERLASIFQ